MDTQLFQREEELINNTSGEKLKQNSAKLKLDKKRGIGSRNISRKKYRTERRGNMT